MNLYDRYLIRRFLGHIFRTCLALVGLFVLIDVLTVRYERIDRFDIPADAVMLYYFYQLPSILFDYHVLSVAMLSAGLMIFGRLAETHEITSMLSGGVSLRRLARPVFALGIVIACASFAVSEFAGVHATAAQAEIDQTYFRQGVGEARGTRSWNNLGEDGWTCNVLSFNRVALTGQDVFMHLNQADRVEEIRARRIYWEPSSERWMLEDGRRFRFDPQQDWEGTTTRITQEAAPFRVPPEELFALEEPPGSKALWTLAMDIQRAERMQIPTQSARVALHEKLARPLVGAIMLLLALPFAMRVRRGGMAVGFGMSLAIAMVFLLVYFGATGLGHLGILPAVAAAWAANAIFFSGGIWLFLRTPT